MRLFKKAAIAAMAVAGAAIPSGMALASSASAQSLHSINSTQLLVGVHTLAPNLVEYNYNEYQPSAANPGYALTYQVTDLCLAGPHGAVCNWRLNNNVAPKLQSDLVGNIVIGPSGTAGSITNGTNAWLHAKGVVRGINFAPNFSNASFVWSQA